MAAAAGSTIVGPPLLAVQVGVDAVLGLLSDTSHPVSGMAFSRYRLRQLRRARAAAGLDRTPRVRRVLGVQAWFWRGNVLLLLATVLGRTVVRPGAERRATGWEWSPWAGRSPSQAPAGFLARLGCTRIGSPGIFG